MKDFMMTMISGSSKVSSKRVVTAVSAFLVFVVVIVDLLTDLTVTDYVFEGLIWMTMAGLGSVALENFANRSNKNTDPYSNTGSLSNENII